MQFPLQEIKKFSCLDFFQRTLIFDYGIFFFKLSFGSKIDYNGPHLMLSLTKCFLCFYVVGYEGISVALRRSVSVHYVGFKISATLMICIYLIRKLLN